MGKKYVVKAGDSLSKIAKELLGDADRWKELYEANKAAIKNPDNIQPGLELDVPGEEAPSAERKGVIKPIGERHEPQ